MTLLVATMDAAYNQHSPHSRHRGRSSLNLNVNHLSLAPLTSRLPLPDEPPNLAPHSSYIEGRSAPTTPSVLSRSSSRVSLSRGSKTNLAKSKSSTHLIASTGRLSSRHGTVPNTPGAVKSRIAQTPSDSNSKTVSDSDWLLRAGTTISSSARESKGQSWLVSRASSTSLAARDEDEEEFERQLAREREITSRRGSTIDADDEYSPATARHSLSFGIRNGDGSRSASRFGSRASSRRGSKVQLFSSLDEKEGYFNHKDNSDEEFLQEPDFVDIEDEGDEVESDPRDDDAIVRRLAKASSLGLGGWVERMLGWSLFALDEDGEETDAEGTDDLTEDSDATTVSRPTKSKLRGGAETPIEERLPPPNPDEANNWQDAAWLLSVASRVLL